LGTQSVTRTVAVAGGRFAPGHVGELIQLVPFEMADAALMATTVFGSIAKGETSYAPALLASLRAGMIVLADRGFADLPAAADRDGRRGQHPARNRPGRASFTIAWQAARDQIIQAAGVTAGPATSLARVIGQHVLAHLLPARRQRISPRLVKRAISKYQARGPCINRASCKATTGIDILTSPTALTATTNA
jgi:hypothetical protein